MAQILESKKIWRDAQIIFISTMNAQWVIQREMSIKKHGISVDFQDSDGVNLGNRGITIIQLKKTHLSVSWCSSVAIAGNESQNVQAEKTHDRDTESEWQIW